MQRAYRTARDDFEPEDELECAAPLDEPPPHPAANKPTVATVTASGTARRARDRDFDVPRLARARIACVGFISTVSLQPF
jgi:hypothetical protein